MPLTDTQCRQAKPKDKPYRLPDGGGLFLLVQPNGSKWWRLKYRFEGKEKLLSLGVYPDVGLKEARDRRDTARKQRAAGIDPAQVRKDEKQAKQTAAANSFEAVARQWHKQWAVDRSPHHAYYTLQRLEADAFPNIGDTPISELTASDFRDIAKKIEARGALDIAKRILQMCGQVMRYAVAHDLAERNPVTDVRPSDIIKSYKKRNYARIDEKELPALLRAIDDYTGSEHTRLALQFMALTFVRTGELIGAKWGEFDLEAKRWNIPAERMKMRDKHIVPLSRQALDVLEKLQALSYGREFVFPSELKPKQAMSNNTILFALYRLGYRGRMTGHGFRGVASTILHEQGYPHEHIELQLAHAPRNAVSAAYNHALYLEARAKMMQAWADYLDRLKAGAEVIPLHGAR